MNYDESQNQYLKLLKAEAEAFERASNHSETKGPYQREDHSRRWFKALAALLSAHLRSNASSSVDRALEPYPGDAIARSAVLFDALAAGRLLQPIHDVNAGGGRPERWPGERKTIATALQYINLARRGEIADRRFIVTVCDAFSVDRTTVRDWQKNSDALLAGLSDVPASAFPGALQKAGARYHFNRTGERSQEGE